MKTIIYAVIIILVGLESCSVTQPDERTYYPQQRVYNSNPYNQYDPYYTPGYDNGYSTRRIYDYNTGHYYDVPVYGAPVYNPNYQNRSYRRNDYRRDNNLRREYYREAQPRNQQPRFQQPGEKRLPDGTKVSPDGTITLPNGEVRRNNR